MEEFRESKYIQTQGILVGVDEVGRGPLFGPVVSCAVLFKGSNLEFQKVESCLKKIGVTDSKKISDSKKEKILNSLSLSTSDLKSDQILNIECSVFNNLSFMINEIQADEIDRINILAASLKSMKLSSEGIILANTTSKKNRSIAVLIDGSKKFNSDITKNLYSVVKGDSKSVLIGLASIIAKVFRDDLMKKWAKKYPGYGLEKHAGYPTKDHKEAIRLLGITKEHRKTFKGVREFENKE